MLKVSEHYPEKTAFVTGAASGLGLACVKMLAKDGWKVGFCDIAADKVDETIAIIKEAGGTPYGYQLDVSDSAAFEKVANDFIEEVGNISLLINNAGIAAGGEFELSTLEDWHKIVDINIMGVVYGTHNFVPHMLKAGKGYIVNVASAASFASGPGMSLYNTTKAAVRSFSESLRVEYKDNGIDVSVVVPIFFQSNLHETMVGSSEGRNFARKMITRSKTDADEVARRMFRDIGKKKMYIFIHRGSKKIWDIKRFSPALLRLIILRGKRRIERKYR